MNDSEEEEMDLSGEQVFLLEFLNSAVHWHENLANTKSHKFQEEASEMENILGKVFNTSSGFFSWNVFQLSKWPFSSDFTKFRVHVKTTGNWSNEELTAILLDAVETGKIESAKMANITVEELDSYSDGSSSHTSTASAVFVLATTEAEVTFSNKSSQREISSISTELSVSKSQLSTCARQVSTASTASQILPVSTESILQGISPVINSPVSSITAATASNERAGTSVLSHTTTTEELVTKKTTNDEFATRKPTILARNTRKFVVSMKMNGYKYVPEMANPDSPTFKKTAAEIEKIFGEIFQKKFESSFKGIEVVKFDPGSVIVTYNVYVSSSSNYMSSDVQNTITNSAGNGELQHMKVDGVTVMEEKEDESSDLTSKSTFVYILYGAGAFLGIAIIVVAVVKVKKGIVRIEGCWYSGGSCAAKEGIAPCNSVRLKKLYCSS